MWILSFFIAKLPEKAEKIEILLRFQGMDEEDEHSPSYLETFDTETETDIGESQEAKDDFINQQKSVNTSKKTATDKNSLFSATLKLMVWKMGKLKAYLRRSFTNVVEIYLNARRKKGEE